MDDKKYSLNEKIEQMALVMDIIFRDIQDPEIREYLKKHNHMLTFYNDTNKDYITIKIKDAPIIKIGV